MYRTIIAACMALGLCNALWAVNLPDETQSTAVSAVVQEQADVSVPPGISFNITDVSALASGIASTPQAVSATNIVLTTGKKLAISINASAAYFTPPPGAAELFPCYDVAYDSGEPWTGGFGDPYGGGFLDDLSYLQIATMSTANSTELSTTNLVFTLYLTWGTVDRAGDHTLSATWKFESF